MTDRKRMQAKAEELWEQKIIYLMGKLDEEFNGYKEGLKRMPPEYIISEAQMIVCMGNAYEYMFNTLNSLPDHKLNAIWDCENPIGTVATHLYNDKVCWQDVFNTAEDVFDCYF